ncbi:MAG: PKD domain-containing protein, partial [Candidatus Eiseniibacteriota bacterium]
MSKRLVFAAVTTALVLVAVAWASVPTTLDDFFLPGSQPGQSGNLEHPSKCDNCHGGYDQAVEPAFNWRGSMMAQAARDPLFYACLAIANQDAPDSGDLCIRCHSPAGWLEGRSVPTDGSALNNNDREGVQCDFCHKLVAPTPLGVDPFPGDPDYRASTYDADQAYLSTLGEIPPASANGMYVCDSNNAKRGPFVDAAARHQMFYSPFHREAALCGTCHDVSNPAFMRSGDSYVPNDFGAPAPDFVPDSMFPIERTYSEWLMSAYNSPEGVYAPQFGGNKQYVSVCQDCHLRDVTGVGCNKRGAPLRDDLPLHDMTGGNTFIPVLVEQLYPDEVSSPALAAGVQRATDMLERAASLDLAVVDQGDVLEATVTVTNETGHKLPSGYPEGRRIWIHVVARDAGGGIVYESGAYDPATATLTHDADVKIYEIKPGISEALAPTLGLDPGPSFHFVLNHEIFKDNRIPPRGFTNAGFAAIQSPPVGYSYDDGQYWDATVYSIPSTAERIDVTLDYQTLSREYVEFLRDANTTDGSGQVLYDLWSANGKSAPVAMSTASWEAPSADPPVADFRGEPLSGPAPLSVQFTDLSTGSPTAWSWDFGDGSTSDAQHPSHVYTTAGTYSVSLTASNAHGADTRLAPDYVTATEPGTVVYVHVEAITVVRLAANGPDQYFAEATVTVFDGGGGPVEGAEVFGTFSGPTTEATSGVTDASGEAVLISKKERQPTGIWCLAVTDVVESGATYDPAANVVTEACEGSGFQDGPARHDGAAFGFTAAAPNPFNPSTEIRFRLPRSERVTVEVYTISGHKVATLVDRELGAGDHAVRWNATDAA